MAKLLFLLVGLTLQSCALTTPEGTKELLEDIKRDKDGLHHKQQENFVGKPIFIKIRSYPRIEASNIYGKQWILMKIGNEKIDLNHLLNDIISDEVSYVF